MNDIVIDSNAPVEYYNLQGVRVSTPAPGLYIRRQGNTATKVLVRKPVKLKRPKLRRPVPRSFFVPYRYMYIPCRDVPSARRTGQSSGMARGVAEPYEM